MADKLKKTDTPETDVPAAALKTAEPEYTVAEFAGNAARLFGQKANADLVNAAFKVAGKESATLSEAKEIVRKFMNREVR